MSLTALLEEIENRHRNMKLSTNPEHQKKLRRRLVNLVEDYNQPETLDLGDFVQLKEGMDDKRLNNPAMIVEILEEPIFDLNHKAGSPYFNNPLNVRIATLGESDGCLVFYYLDIKRLKKVEFDESDVELI